MEQYDSKNKLASVYHFRNSRQGFGPDLYPIITQITKGHSI